MTGKVAVVTGASRVIGATIARRLADAGVRLGLASRSGDDLGLPVAVARATDVRDRGQVWRLVDGAYGPFQDLPPEVAFRPMAEGSLG
jgi:NAD(P)-dependent dehydrogenase (short-subunit alcohol dehydrogenase family)